MFNRNASKNSLFRRSAGLVGVGSGMVTSAFKQLSLRGTLDFTFEAFDIAEMEALSMTVIPADLIKAYESTDFRVLEPQAFTMRVGRYSPELQALYADLRVSSAGYLTAWNPFSAETSEEDNRKAQSHLLRRLSVEGFPAMNALGIDPSGDWLGEESIFVPGLDLERAKALGVEFGQNAVVWADADAVPQLVLLR